MREQHADEGLANGSSLLSLMDSSGGAEVTVGWCLGTLMPAVPCKAQGHTLPSGDSVGHACWERLPLSPLSRYL